MLLHIGIIWGIKNHKFIRCFIRLSLYSSLEFMKFSANQQPLVWTPTNQRVNKVKTWRSYASAWNHWFLNLNVLTRKRIWAKFKWKFSLSEILWNSGISGIVRATECWKPGWASTQVADRWIALQFRQIGSWKCIEEIRYWWWKIQGSSKSWNNTSMFMILPQKNIFIVNARQIVQKESTIEG